MRIILGICLSSLIAGIGLTAENIFTDGLRKAGQGLEAGAKGTGKLAGRGAKAAGKGVAKGAKKGVHEVARGTAKGASKVEDKTN
jgi:hypothetical protein